MSIYTFWWQGKTIHTFPQTTHVSISIFTLIILVKERVYWRDAKRFLGLISLELMHIYVLLSYNKTKLAVDKERLDHQRNIYNHLPTQAKLDFFKTKIETAETSKDLYKVCDNLDKRDKTLLINALLILMIK